ncbi:MAG: PspC domain-containing protein [Odoribacteraceae bacterium]|jgi:phage shock protein PspC (stress-responsive transcriptional regulator)|nr:PspC domain-containing protein [Odoribacteraceae bacterium]
MKKVVTTRLGDKVFQMEEDAYDYLRGALEKQWKRQELEPLVARELERGRASEDQPITLERTREALAALGISAAAGNPPRRPDAPRRLCRPANDRKIGGVCAGLARYFDVDPVLFRVLFLVGWLCTLMVPGLFLYIILCIAMPREQE